MGKNIVSKVIEKNGKEKARQEVGCQVQNIMKEKRTVCFATKFLHQASQNSLAIRRQRHTLNVRKQLRKLAQ